MRKGRPSLDLDNEKIEIFEVDKHEQWRRNGNI